MCFLSDPVPSGLLPTTTSKYFPTPNFSRIRSVGSVGLLVATESMQPFSLRARRVSATPSYTSASKRPTTLYLSLYLATISFALASSMSNSLTKESYRDGPIKLLNTLYSGYGIPAQSRAYFIQLNIPSSDLVMVPSRSNNKYLYIYRLPPCENNGSGTPKKRLPKCPANSMNLWGICSIYILKLPMNIT